MLGFVLWALVCSIYEYHEFAVVLMVLAVNFKQMALYFVLPFAIFTIARLVRELFRIGQHGQSNLDLNDINEFISRATRLASAFFLSVTILLGPFIMTERGMDALSDISDRIFPVRRGIFEDKVATFWCVLHNFCKYIVNDLSMDT